MPTLRALQQSIKPPTSRLRPANLPNNRERKPMKIITQFTNTAFAVVVLATGALTANADPGDIFVSDGARAIIDKITPDGTVSRFAGAPDIGGISGLAFDSAGNLFASDADYNSIR